LPKTLLFIEPLIDKLKYLIKDGQRDVLSKGSALFGEDIDMDSLANVLTKYKNDQSKIVLIDLIPIASLGTYTRLQILEELYDEMPFIILAKKGMVSEQVKTLRNLSTIVIDENNIIIDSIFSGKWKRQLKNSIDRRFKIGDSIFDIHMEWVENTLLDRIPHCIIRPPVNTRLLALHDGAWANLWIDVKSLFSDPEDTFFLAYQIGYALTQGYSIDLPEDGFVTSNNTAYVMASFLRQIFDKKELIVIDRLGPYPNLTRTKLIDLSNKVQGKRLCVVEDVISSGREIDMTYLVIYSNEGEVERVATLFNLELTKPKFIDTKRIVSLCRPSAKIGYKRVPMYEINRTR
jgi:hypothetical protein